MNYNTTFVLGGCRSGKSRHALEIAQKLTTHKRFFFATCVPYDDEMKDRVGRHQAERDQTWQTVETPIDLADAIDTYQQQADVILIDCLTLWCSNLLLNGSDENSLSDHLQKFTLSIKNACCPIILVSNEVGTGIVPENKLARLFRDMVGKINQGVASCAETVIWMVAGIPVTIKG